MMISSVLGSVVHHGTHWNASFDVIEANATLHLAYAAFCNESALMAWDCQWCSGPGTYAEPMQVQVRDLILLCALRPGSTRCKLHITSTPIERDPLPQLSRADARVGAALTL